MGRQRHSAAGQVTAADRPLVGERVVVNFHGGPELQSRAGFNEVAQSFVSEGFVYVEPNVRGSDGYGKTWVHSADGPKRLAVITDIEDTSRHVRTAWASALCAPSAHLSLQLAAQQEGELDDHGFAL